MSVGKAGEDYLEAILILHRQKGMVRSVDLARYMNYSKPSISHAVKVLKKQGCLNIDEDGNLHLTDIGKRIAEKIYERHRFFTNALIEASVEPEAAERDACRMEHAISQESFEKLRDALQDSQEAVN